jgi:hypothetical protein
MVKGGNMGNQQQNMTREQITARAQQLAERLAGDLGKFTTDTGCVIRVIDIFTDEKPLGQTGLFSVRQSVQAHFIAPKEHPAFQEVKHAN